MKNRMNRQQLEDENSETKVVNNFRCVGIIIVSCIKILCCSGISILKFSPHHKVSFLVANEKNFEEKKKLI